MIQKTIYKSISSIPIGRMLLAVVMLVKLYLKEEGWNKSVLKGMPCDKNGEVTPWFTYSSLHFLNNRLKKDFIAFEFGSGNSTLWLSKTIKNVVSVEHDKRWHEKMNPRFEKISNIKYFYKTVESGDYAREILNHKSGFDLVIIDGQDRVECCKNAVTALNPDGVVIFDNSDRVDYSEGYQFLISSGFRRIDFWGMGPINPYSWCTTIFYRRDNCLEI